MVPSRNLDKANFPFKKKGKQCAAFVPLLPLPQVYARRHVFLLSIYRSMLILFSVNYG